MFYLDKTCCELMIEAVFFLHGRSPAAGRIPMSFLVAHSHPPAGASEAVKTAERFIE
jgi:hypothetical protein